MEGCCPKEMSRTVGKGDAGKSFGLTRAGVKHMPRKGSSSTPSPGKTTTPIELKHTNWRAKNKPDPKEVEYKAMMSSMGFANL